MLKNFSKGTRVCVVWGELCSRTHTHTRCNGDQLLDLMTFTDRGGPFLISWWRWGGFVMQVVAEFSNIANISSVVDSQLSRAHNTQHIRHKCCACQAWILIATLRERQVGEKFDNISVFYSAALNALTSRHILRYPIEFCLFFHWFIKSEIYCLHAVGNGVEVSAAEFSAWWEVRNGDAR